MRKNLSPLKYVSFVCYVWLCWLLYCLYCFFFRTHFSLMLEKEYEHVFGISAGINTEGPVFWKRWWMILEYVDKMSWHFELFLSWSINNIVDIVFLENNIIESYNWEQDTSLRLCRDLRISTCLLDALCYDLWVS